MSHTKPGVRGCGFRVQGGIYAECGHSPFGQPLEYFLIDPPLPAEPDALGLAPVGVTLIEDGEGTTHVVDWIGSTHYPNVADFLEEVRALGMSRRLPKSLEFEKLQPGSRMLLVHTRAMIENHGLYFVEQPDHTCPQNIETHAPSVYPTEMCAGLWWQDAEPTHLSRVEREVMETAGIREFERTMPAFSYTAHTRPWGVQPDYAPAFFASLPISNLSVIKAKDGSHEAAAEAANHSGINQSLDDA